MEGFIKSLAENPTPFIIIGVVIVFLVFLALYFFNRKRKSMQQTIEDEALVRVKISPDDKKEPAPPGIKDKSPKTDSGIIIDNEQDYRVLVWDINGEIYFSRINKPVGNIFFADATLPENGQTFFVTKDGTKIEPFDPRSIKIESEKTPQMAYFATHWDRAEGVWMFSSGIMETISKILMIAMPAATFLIILVAIGG